MVESIPTIFSTEFYLDPIVTGGSKKEWMNEQRNV